MRWGDAGVLSVRGVHCVQRDVGDVGITCMNCDSVRVMCMRL